MMNLNNLKIDITLKLLVIVIFLENQINGEIFERSFIRQSRQTQKCSERKMPGLICESCDRLAFCIEINGHWETYPVEPCDVSNGQYCNIYEEKCTDTPGPCNRMGYEGNFPCTSDGIFPDPYDCQIYHMCYQAEPDVHDYLPIAGTANCEGSRAYSVATSECSLTLLDETCKKKQYECNYPGETHSWPGNPNIFYICQPEINIQGKHFLYPTLYRCGPGDIYNNRVCLPKNESNSSSPNWSTKKRTNATVPSTPIINETTKNNDLHIFCKENSGLKPNPTDCHSYYYCQTINGPVIHRTCPKNTFFNKVTLSCNFGGCSNLTQ